ncbi:hypothetical protein LshimejAT787_0107390 [Lyophyllum shimeji]|uniref:Uncharacterized protein n=1 Tax=Lyophyllum shimeji TaxID=47721 RepID=A0A9P3PDA4_LYOSH|nr:hypothetical protein LshimejAT787_0107390 [Lyophyllum shimeji]
MADAKATVDALAAKANAVERAAKISFEIREALRKALPAPPEQFFTVMIPGKVVNFADYSKGFDDEGNQTTAVLPTVTQLNQAILCDDMPVLAPIQLGPTGRSVARSYDAALSKLIPAGTTVGVDVKDPKNLTEEEQRYKKAMDYLLSRHPQHPEKTRVQMYTEKQKAYTQAVEAKTKAFREALEKAMNDPRYVSLDQKQQAFNDWVAENARTYRNFMQGAYMDWVVTGMKEEVEYWFAVVDRETAMARVEASKEAMRAAVVHDTDGAVEYQTVRCTPPNWAHLAKKKALSKKNRTRTPEWYSWEISRLEKMNGMLRALKKATPSFPIQPEPPTSQPEQLEGAMTKFLKAREAYQQAAADKNAKDEDKKRLLRELQTVRGELAAEEAKVDRDKVQNLTGKNQEATRKLYEKLQGDDGLVTKILEENEKKIKAYTEELQAVLGGTEKGQTIVDEVAKDLGVPRPLPDPAAQPAGSDEEDYFTAITVEISSSGSEEHSDSKATSTSFGASGGWGLFSASVDASHSESAANASAAMAKNACKISFECMRVDISRSWLRPELFYDADLTVGPNEFISPGFGRLRELMESTSKSAEQELQRYSTFPLYPTAFLLAANIVLEISGETSAIQSHFQSSATSVSASVGYGPFSMHASVSTSAQEADSSCEAIAQGCRITIKSPQIIGWISQMVPALPRIENPVLPV